MRIFLDCIPCFIRQALDSVRLITDDEKMQEQVVREVLVLTSDLDMSESPPAMAQQIHRLIRKLIGNHDPYRELKQRFNVLALRMCAELKERVRTSKDPLETTVRLAIAGNIIDLGVKTSIKESDIKRIISDCLTADFGEILWDFGEKSGLKLGLIGFELALFSGTAKMSFLS